MNDVLSVAVLHCGEKLGHDVGSIPLGEVLAVLQLAEEFASLCKSSA